jgi:hypothetical protein
MAVYSEVTLADLVSRTAEKLGDVAEVFWLHDELVGLVNEALATWQAFSGYWTERVEVPLVGSQWVYDLPGVVDELAYTTTADDLIIRVKQSLLEPLIVDEFYDQLPTLDQHVLFALRSAYEKWLRDAGLVTVYQEIAPVADVVTLPEQNLGIRYCEWKAEPAVAVTSHYFTELRETQTDQVDYTFYRVLGQPKGYSVLNQPINSIRLYPTPEDIGKLALFNNQLPSATQLEVGAIPIPPGLDWVLKYAMLAELLGHDGQARDPYRESYCRQRYADSLVLGRNYPGIYNAWLNGITVRIGAISDIAARRPRWHSDLGQPVVLGAVSWNHLVVTPAPTAASLITTPITLMLEIQSTPPVLVSGTDVVQLPREYHDMLVDYVVHLALLKTSGAEFQASIGAYKNMLLAAMDFNSRLLAKQSDLWLFKKRSTQDYQRRGRDVVEGHAGETGEVVVKGGGR